MIATIELVLILFLAGGQTQTVVDSNLGFGYGTFEDCVDEGMERIGTWQQGGLVYGFGCQNLIPYPKEER